MNDIDYPVLQRSILKTLLYYDIFNYPLNTDEVFRFLGTNSVTQGDVATALTTMAQQKQVYRHGDLFSVQENNDLFQRRVRGNQVAARHIDIARRKARLIAGFPFVRGVLASGSLSKGYMDERSDIDFFIITAPGRLWIARMLLVMYKRIFLFNSHKFFCVNYFVDTNHLEIEEKNIFTATELATALPLYGASLYSQLIGHNSWLREFFPNFKPRSLEGVPEGKSKPFKRFSENLTSVLGGDFLNHFFMSLTQKRWNTLYKRSYSDKDFTIAFKTKEYTSKNHPNHFQRKVIERYTQKLNDYAAKHAIDLL